MLEEARVFGGDDCVFHDLGNVLDAHKVRRSSPNSPIRTPSASEDAKRNTRLVVEERVEWRQPVIDEQRGERPGEHNGSGERKGCQGEREQQPS